jgi:hypothetical protein
MDRKALNYVNSKLEERRTELLEFLGEGGAKDYAHYKEVCGVIRGLQTAQSELGDLVRKIKEFEDE